MDKLKALFGSEALTFEQLEEKLKDNKEVKLANLAAGGYVDVKKHEDTVQELTTANSTIKNLQETVKKFDGVDVEGLKKQASDLEEKYNKDTAALKLDSAVNLALVQAKVKNPKLAKAALDMSVIKLDGENLLGLTEQVEALKESDGYLFDTDEGAGGAKVNTGGHHNNNNNTDSFMSAFMKGAGIEEKKGAN
ncbi:MAG: phage scaffolding protein [Clostridia bacterium]|nr:phage scaffolding protein [Clostridia bacterium]